MIPRFAPPLDGADLRASLHTRPDGVRVFEDEAARRFGVTRALAFSYGRAALWAFIEALGIKDAEIVLPAYTCSVVAHAIKLSGNVPRFVDSGRSDFNTDLDALADAIGPRTRMIVATHLFGYALDLDRLDAITADAQRRLGRPIVVVHDCAHSFDARWRDRSVCQAGDAALLAFGISKTITAIFGGMLLFGDGALAATVEGWRDARFRKPGALKAARRRAYLWAADLAFRPPAYTFVNWLETQTPLLDRLTKAYHLDDRVHFPPDYLEQLSPVEAAVGISQLAKYAAVVNRRRAHAAFYAEALAGLEAFTLPPLVEGATYSHYVVRVSDPDWWVARLAARGIQLGRLIDYSVPAMTPYRSASPDAFPNALRFSREVINLPVHFSLSDTDRQRVVDALWAVAQAAPARRVA